MQGGGGKLHAACVFSDLKEGRLWTGAPLGSCICPARQVAHVVMLSVVTQVEEKSAGPERVDGGGSLYY